MTWELCLLLPLLLTGRTMSEMQPLYQPPSETLDFGYVPAKTYDTSVYHEPGAIGILFRVVHAFLYLVQPNYFPQGKNLILNCSKRVQNYKLLFVKMQTYIMVNFTSFEINLF